MIEGTQEYNEKLIKRLHKVKYALAAPPVRLASFGAENFKNCYTKFEHKNYSLKNEQIFFTANCDVMKRDIFRIQRLLQ